MLILLLVTFQSVLIMKAVFVNGTKLFSPPLYLREGTFFGLSEKTAQFPTRIPHG